MLEKISESVIMKMMIAVTVGFATGIAACYFIDSVAASYIVGGLTTSFVTFAAMSILDV